MKVDIAIVGGGLVGGSIARALCQSGLSLALVEPRSPPMRPRDSARLRSTMKVRYLEVRYGRGSQGVLRQCVTIFGDDGPSRVSAYRSSVSGLRQSWKNQSPAS
jgi:glycine/D-amino acid oxidase-like deaminating enzyme